jgi:hypothetical protein
LPCCLLPVAFPKVPHSDTREKILFQTNPSESLTGIQWRRNMPRNEVRGFAKPISWSDPSTNNPTAKSLQNCCTARPAWELAEIPLECR